MEMISFRFNWLLVARDQTTVNMERNFEPVVCVYGTAGCASIVLGRCLAA